MDFGASRRKIPPDSPERPWGERVFRITPGRFPDGRDTPATRGNDTKNIRIGNASFKKKVIQNTNSFKNMSKVATNVKK